MYITCFKITITKTGPSSGGSLDWVKGVAGIKNSICLELRPSNTGPDSTYGN